MTSSAFRSAACCPLVRTLSAGFPPAALGLAPGLPLTRCNGLPPPTMLQTFFPLFPAGFPPATTFKLGLPPVGTANWNGSGDGPGKGDGGADLNPSSMPSLAQLELVIAETDMASSSRIRRWLGWAERGLAARVSTRRLLLLLDWVLLRQ